jgi:D-alanyl-D-alanine carboxypeptidase/D-alanyl-D-alanine-endopeptidase (penicillin-binding protein 4)
VQTGDYPGCNAIKYTRPVGSMDLRIDGSIPSGAKPCAEQIAIQDPAEYAARALKLALEKRGVRITGSAKAAHAYPYGNNTSAYPGDPAVAKLIATPSSLPPCKSVALDSPEPTVIARHTSATLAEDITFTNKVSQNLHAEIFLRDVGERVTCGGTLRDYLRVERQFLTHIGLDPADFVFYDGSGLSGHDLVTPRATAKLLQYATTQPWFADWRPSLPIGGEDGSLSGRFAKPPLKDHVFAKTGTLGEARALSGYLDAASGRTVIFSVMDTDHAPGAPADRDTMDKIVAAIQAAE